MLVVDGGVGGGGGGGVSATGTPTSSWMCVLQNIHLDVEIALARKALVLIALSYVAAYVLRIFAGRL